MKRMGVLSMAFAAALAVACNGNARTDGRTDTGATETVGTAGEADRTAVHESDKDFVSARLSSGASELEMSKLASERTMNPDVKRFSQMLIEDHTKSGDELRALAAKYSIPTSVQVDEKHQERMNTLSKMRGADFDREYINVMVGDHENAVDALETRVDSTAGLKDRITKNDTATGQIAPEKTDNAPQAAVNEWAAKSLPTIRHHLDEAKKLDDRLDAPQSTSK